MKTKKFKVSGIAFVPVEVCMEIDTANEELAIAIALERFGKKGGKFVVPGSVDTDYPFDWKPFAEEVE